VTKEGKLTETVVLPDEIPLRVKPSLPTLATVSSLEMKVAKSVTSTKVVVFPP